MVRSLQNDVTRIIGYFSEISSSYAVGRVNVDDCKEFAEKYHVENLPTLLIFKNGEEVGRVIGYMNPENLDREIADSLV